MISSVKTPPTYTQSKPLGTGIASESQHWYDKQGAPIYEVPCKSREGTRPTNIGDGRKLDLVPSWTLIGNCIAKPGLQTWKEDQLAMACLTLPKKQGESLDAFLKRAREDSKAQGIAASDRGTQLHKAIETYIQYKALPMDVEPIWGRHCCKVQNVLAQHGIDLLAGQQEHSFAQQIDGNWYGGKIDYHKRASDTTYHYLIDFKSKDKIEPKKPLVYDEHAMQISAYGYGLFGIVSSNREWKWEAFRGLNVFVGVNDCEVRVIEHTPDELAHGFELFRSILDFWTRKHFFGKYTKEK